MDSNRRRARYGGSLDYAPSTLSKPSKTTFIGVFALSRPSKARSPQVHSSNSSHSSHEHASSSSSRPVQNNTSTSTIRKRKRTPSDGCDSQISGDSFNLDALVASQASAAPSAHLRLHESLTSIPGIDQRLDGHASSHKHNLHASTSTLPSFKRHISTPLVAVRQAEAELGSPHPHHAAADRKGKGRQSSIPCLEIADRNAASRSQRAHSSLPTSASSNKHAIALSEGPDHIDSRIRRAQSARPSMEDVQFTRKRTSVQREEVLPKNLAEVLFGPVDSQHVPNAVTKPCLIRPSESIQGFLASHSHSPSTKVSVPAVTATRIVSPGTSKYFQRANNATKRARQEVSAETITESQESIPSLSTGNTSPKAIEQSPADLFLSHEEMICISSSENEQENELLPEVDDSQPDSQTKTSIRKQKTETISQQEQGMAGSASRKSVKFAVEESVRDRRRNRKGNRRISSSITRTRRSAQEYFAGEGEDYQPSDAEEISAESSEATSPRSKESMTAFGSSPLTPLSSSNTRSGVAPVEPELVNFLQILTRSPGSARSNRNTKPTSRSHVNRTISDSDDSDADGEVPLRRLQARSRSPQKDTTRHSRPRTVSSARSVRSRKASSNTSVAVVAPKGNSNRTLFTRSKATGESAECRQCHRCETYQPKTKTLRCMTCEQAVCTTCLATYYAGHPSYAATLAFMQVDSVTKASSQNVDVSEVDFRCPVCKFLCRCTVCLRGPFPKTVALRAPLPTEIESPERSQSMQRSESLLSSDADLEPLHWPGLVRGTSTRPNLKVRLRVSRPSSYSRLSNSAQNLDSASNAYYDLQDAIAGEAARRAQLDAETDYVPDVSSRQHHKNPDPDPENALASASQTVSTDSDDTDIVQVASSRRPRPALSARVRLATKVGQQLGKSPAYVESRRSPRREGDQLIPYNNNEPVLTLGPDVDMPQSEISDSHPPASSMLQSIPGEMADTFTALPSGEQQLQNDEEANELLDSLLELPDNDITSEEGADIPALEDHPSTEIDYLSPSDTLTSTSVSSLASPPAIEDKTVRFETTKGTSGLNPVLSDASIFRPGIAEEDWAFPFSSPSSTPTLRSRFLHNPTSPGSAIKGFSSPYPFSTSHHNTMDDYLYGSPSRHTAFDIDLMPDWAFDNLVHA